MCVYRIQAAEGGSFEAAEMLLDADSSALRSRDNHGRTPSDCVPTNASQLLHSLLS